VSREGAAGASADLRDTPCIGPVEFSVPAEVAFDYLADPRNRPEWQLSLRAVEVLDEGPVRAGMRWLDVTWPGPRPQLEIVSMRRPDEWVELGRWRGVEGVLRLTFEPAPRGCRVSFQIHVSGPVRPLGVVLTAAALLPVNADLKRAARVLARG
jgi:uncharacterized membrane protein